MKKVMAVLFLTFLALSPASARDSVLIEEFWYDLETIVPGEPILPVPPEDAAKKLLEEARWVFSGMLYGFTFVYKPGDARYEIEDEFAMEPIAEIPFGDPSLSIVQSRLQGKRLIVRIRYDLRPYQLTRLEGWDSNMFPSASGEGSASFLQGRDQRVTAIKEGARQALRNHLRSRIFDRPHEIKGDFVFEQAPRVILAAGEFKALVKIRLYVREMKTDEYR